MSATHTETLYGVRRPDGCVEPMSETAAEAAYMTAEQLAAVRASVVRGVVVRRQRVTTLTDWMAVSQA
jgi:hypothetical protein